MTRWAADVSPENVLPEYPRPQMVRPRWQNLNGLWQFGVAEEGEAPPIGRELPERILVPYPVESALSGVGRHHDRVWYRRTFRVPAASDERVLLHFGAVDWQADVYVNGRTIGSHRGGYDGFTFDVTDVLRPSGEQELVVGVYDPTNRGEQPRGKQREGGGRIWYTPVTGIWQTVWLEPVPAARIGRLVLMPEVEAEALRLTVEGAGASPGDRIVAVAMADGREVGRAEGVAGSELRIPVPDPRLWSPEDPFLYDLRVSLGRGGEEADVVESYFGMRTVSLGKHEDGTTRIFLNGEPVFQVGPLDQGWWPDGLYTAPTDEALRYDLEVTKQLGFNMTRKHLKVESARWYYWADKLGVPIWQDMPNGGNGTPEARRQFEIELREVIKEFRSHPSIIVWIPFNEGWGQYGTRRITEMVREMDPSRLVVDASGWQHTGAGDLIDVHRYPGPQAVEPTADRASVVGEFGGLGMVVPGHTWAGEGWGYRGVVESRDVLTARYAELLGRMWRLRDSHGMSAGVYTQLTDIEREVNGLLTYDRAVLKIDTAGAAAINRGIVPLLLPGYTEFTDSVRVTIVQGRPTEIRYTTDGGEPTVRSARYERPFVLHGNATVSARAFVDGVPAGPVVRASYRRVRGREPVAVSGVVPGVSYAYFERSSPAALWRLGDAHTLPDTVRPTSTGSLSGFALVPRRRDETFAFRYTGFLRVHRTGVYTLTAAADDGVKLWIGETPVVDALRTSPGRAESAGSIALQAGLHPITLDYFQAEGEFGLDIYIEGPGLEKRPMRGAMLFHTRSPTLVR